MHHIFMRTGACALTAALVLMMGACSGEVIDEPASDTIPGAIAAAGSETQDTTLAPATTDSSDPSATETESASTTAPNKTPVQDKQLALTAFNNAANAVKTDRPAMKKERETKFMGFAEKSDFWQKFLDKMDVIPQEDPVNFPKGTNYNAIYPMFHYSWSSKLSANDIRSISCKESGNNYLIHIDMPDELIPTSATDYSKYKHGRALGVITGDEIKRMMGGDGLKQYDQLYTGCYIDAIVNKATGKMVKATYVMNFRMTISGKAMGIPVNNLSVSLQITEIYSF